jgi:hypothetical protein
MMVVFKIPWRAYGKLSGVAKERRGWGKMVRIPVPSGSLRLG